MRLFKQFKKNFSFLFFISILFLYSCTPLYIPNQLNVPLLQKAGDFNASLAASLSLGEAQLAYSPINNLGFIANVSGFKGSEYNFFEFGGGYYKPLGASGIFEVYSGFGFGNSEATDRFGNMILEDFTRFFVQPSWGVKSRSFEGAISLRTCYVDFPRYGSGIFFEPALTARAGFKNFKFTSQFGVSANLSGQQGFGHSPWIINLGIIFQIR